MTDSQAALSKRIVQGPSEGELKYQTLRERCQNLEAIEVHLPEIKDGAPMAAGIANASWR